MAVSLQQEIGPAGCLRRPFGVHTVENGLVGTTPKRYSNQH
jgi:hypothetical protein